MKIIDTIKPIVRLGLLLSILHLSPVLHADSNLPDKPLAQRPAISKPLITPTPPPMKGKAYILIDVNSGKIIAEQNSQTKLPPASLTKMMTLYVISNALHNEQIHLTDSVRISKEAWQAPGSRMFVKEGQQVTIEELMKGIIVDSGNDACVAMAEHLGGSEQGFADIMNQEAQALGMTNSHFTDSNGLPNENHYTTAKDLAILGRALINDFPEYYSFYKQKWFAYNGIRQPNRNRLLWRDEQVDGIKTGHTDEAGFCLVSSAQRDGMRLLAVVLGEPSDGARADDSQRLLNYGFRFFETHEIYKANQSIVTLPVYKGTADTLQIGVFKPLLVTIPSGQYQRLGLKTKVKQNLEAPIQKGDKIGELIIEFENKVVDTQPLYALSSIESGGFFLRMKDSAKLTVHSWFTS